MAAWSVVRGRRAGRRARARVRVVRGRLAETRGVELGCSHGRWARTGTGRWAMCQNGRLWAGQRLDESLWHLAAAMRSSHAHRQPSPIPSSPFNAHTTSELARSPQTIDSLSAHPISTLSLPPLLLPMSPHHRGHCDSNRTTTPQGCATHLLAENVSRRLVVVRCAGAVADLGTGAGGASERAGCLAEHDEWWGWCNARNRVRVREQLTARISRPPGGGRPGRWEGRHRRGGQAGVSGSIGTWAGIRGVALPPFHSVATQGAPAGYWHSATT